MRHNRPVHTYVVVVAERQEILTCELGAVVGDDRVRDPEPEDDVGKEQNACSDLILPMGRASIHLENLSTATNKWV